MNDTRKSLVSYRTKRLWAKFKKLRTRLNQQLEQGNFQQFSKNRQRGLLLRLSRYQTQLKTLGYTAVLSTPLLLTPATADTQVSAVGAEFQTNTYTTANQYSPSTATDSNGDFVVTWVSDGQDGNDLGIYGQLYSDDGSLEGTEFLINSHTTSSQTKPSVAMDSEGDFVVVWESLNQDGDGSGIYGQRYDSNGSPAGTEFLVNTYTTSSQTNPSVAMDNEGDFVVIWESLNQNGGSLDIYGQRYNDDGSSAGIEFLVNTHTTSSQTNPSIAIDNKGDFTVIWESMNQDGDGSGIYGQRYDSNGILQGIEFQINSHTTNSQADPSIAMDSDGGFVVVWESMNQDGDDLGIYGQQYDDNGVPQETEFQINSYTINSQANPSVAMDSDGDFAVVWDSYGQDGSYYSVYGQLYSSNGVPQEAEFQINTLASGYQNEPSITMDDSGDFIVSWQGDQGISGYGIYGQLYSGPILPVELLDFSARPNNDDEIHLEWHTASEINNQGFEIQRLNNSEWEKLGFVEGNGNSVRIESYSFMDNQPQVGQNYYRLRQLDYDGTEAFSDIVSVTLEKKDEKMQVFPNPVQDGEFTVLLPEGNTDEEANLELYNTLGILVHKTIVYSGNQLQIDGLAKGLYLLVIKKGDQQWQERVLNQ